MVTRTGLEGGGIYALSAAIRDAHRCREARPFCTSTCVPTSRPTALTAKLGAPRGKQSLSTFLRKAASLAPVAIGLLA